MFNTDDTDVKMSKVETSQKHVQFLTLRGEWDWCRATGNGDKGGASG